MSRAKLIAVLAGVVLLRSNAAQARPCPSYTTPEPFNSWEAGDVFYEPNVWQSHINRYWSHFAMESSDWQGEWGYNDVGNVEKPLAKVLNAMWALENSTPPNPQSGSVLGWSYDYARNAIDEIQTTCATSSIAYTRYGVFIDNYTRLYIPYFYEQNVPVRASTLVHEARHADGWGSAKHNCGGGALDSTFQYDGAWAWEYEWLKWFYYDAANTTDALRLSARDAANGILAGSFCTDPGWRI